MLLLVSYDLKVPGRDYAKLYETLKTASTWWHYLESTWILSTSDNINTWSDKIRAVLDANDNFIVVNITGQPHHGWLPQDAWKWIKDQSS